jgi:mannose-6-phosphate isomerase-like protein (cupin superfamily)|tara:strand:+ start:5887 stop:6312 length:426 start_codon:yes stop_codon:yes gene_type:complete
MESTNTTDNSYGRKDLPPILKCEEKRDKYWGHITTVFATDDFTLKEVFMKANTQSSMEYHVTKDEYYYIQSGLLKVGMRIGRAQNKSVILGKGDVFHIPPGLMHMRIALEDTVIIEWSNKDDDADSNIVEDGKTYKFKEDK